MSYTNSKRSALICCTLVLSILAGCGGEINPNEALAKVNSTNAQRLANLYFTFHTNNEWRGPADDAEFKNYIRGLDTEKLSRIGVDSNQIDALFVSERDGEPFKIRYAVNGSAMGSTEPVVFESRGVDGKRQVAFLNMTQREVDDAEYQSLWTKGAQSTEPARER